MRLFLVAAAVLAASFAVVMVAGTKDTPRTPRTAETRWTIARTLPALPPQGVAIGRGAGTALLDLHGKQVAAIPGLRVVDGQVGAGRPTLIHGDKLYELDARRHLVLRAHEGGGGGRSATFSTTFPRVTAFSSSNPLPDGCFPIVHAHRATFARCDLSSRLKGALVAVRDGTLHTIVPPDESNLFFAFELAPDRSVFAGQLDRRGRRTTCDARLISVDTRTLTAHLSSGIPLGYTRGGALVVRRVTDCPRPREDVLLVGRDGTTVIARDGKGASLWGDAGTMDLR